MKLICVYCGERFAVSKFTKRTCYDYECPDCQSERKNKKSRQQNTDSSKTLGNVKSIISRKKVVSK